jgi:hypothetical protein
MLDFKRTRHADPIFLDPDAGTPIPRGKLPPEHNDCSSHAESHKSGPDM